MRPALPYLSALAGLLVSPSVDGWAFLAAIAVFAGSCVVALVQLAHTLPAVGCGDDRGSGLPPTRPTVTFSPATAHRVVEASAGPREGVASPGSSRGSDPEGRTRGDSQASRGSGHLRGAP